jgi:hypothetical protein
MTMLCGISLLISFETTNLCLQLMEDHQDDKDMQNYREYI